ncbi:hypothetical protein Aperf_G00000085222 [Anoplocephala perfoliata]
MRLLATHIGPMLLMLCALAFARPAELRQEYDDFYDHAPYSQSNNDDLDEMSPGGLHRRDCISDREFYDDEEKDTGGDYDDENKMYPDYQRWFEEEHPHGTAYMDIKKAIDQRNQKEFVPSWGTTETDRLNTVAVFLRTGIGNQNGDVELANAYSAALS